MTPEVKIETKNEMKNSRRNLWIRTSLIGFGVLVVAGGLAYWKSSYHQVFIDKADIEAPMIGLSPDMPGTLQEVYVHEGDTVLKDMPVARVDNQLIKSKVAGTIVTVNNIIGALVPAGTPVVTMIDPNQLRVVGQLDEDKGLSSIQVGDRVTFTVDAEGGKQYQGVVDEISPTSAQSGIVFSISDKRAIKQFAIKALFDIKAYAELKNGMSARMWIYYHGQ